MNRLPIVLLSLLFITGAVWDSTAVKKVRAGVRFFSSGEFPKAKDAFSEAETADPDNDTIVFDQACALMVQGESTDARDLFQQASLASDTRLSAASHYNLGNLAAAMARETLGPDPVNVEPSKREEVVSELLSAVGHYRDCLRVSSMHPEARHNLELIRLFIKHIQAQWEERDREKAREELGLLEFLSMLENKQRALRILAGTFTEQESTPQNRQLRRETADSQRQLHEEIGPLKEKLAAELQKAVNQSGQDQANQESQIQSVLNQLADTAGEAMLRAADQIQTAGTDVARQTQREVLDQFNELYMVVAPFGNVVQRAIPVQDGLIQQSGSTLSGTLKDDEASDTSATSTVRTEKPDGAQAELAWEQSRITDWSRLLSLKAESELPQMESQLESHVQENEAETEPKAQTEPDANAQDPSKQLRALVESMKKAIELAPKAEQHSASAESHMNSAATDQTLDEQQEALRLLKEIAEPLKDDEQQDNDEKQNSDDQEQEEQQDQQQKDEPGDDTEQNKPPNEQQQPSQEQVESVLKKAREREREHRDLEKELRKILGGLVPVDKDW